VYETRNGGKHCRGWRSGSDTKLRLSWFAVRKVPDATQSVTTPESISPPHNTRRVLRTTPAAKIRGVNEGGAAARQLTPPSVDECQSAEGNAPPR